MATPSAGSAIPLTVIGSQASFDGWLKQQPDHVQHWLASVQQAQYDPSLRLSLLPDTNGASVGAAVFCANNSMLHSFGALARMLPRGQLFTLSEFHGMDSMSANGPDDLELAMLGFALGGYRYETYKFGSKAPPGQPPPRLVWPSAGNAQALAAGERPTLRIGAQDRVSRAASATYLVRDLINTPARDMCPAGLEEAARNVADAIGANCRVLTGAELLGGIDSETDTGAAIAVKEAKGGRGCFPMIWAVGEAAARRPYDAADRFAPRLIDLTWAPESPEPVDGDSDSDGEKLPLVVVVGKGVTARPLNSSHRNRSTCADPNPGP